NAFLHHMMRNIVGSLVYVGKGAHPPEWIGTVLAGRDRARAAPTFEAAGLYLAAVEYEAHWGLPVVPSPSLDEALYDRNDGSRAAPLGHGTGSQDLRHPSARGRACIHSRGSACARIRVLSAEPALYRARCGRRDPACVAALHYHGGAVRRRARRRSPCRSRAG